MRKFLSRRLAPALLLSAFCWSLAGCNEDSAEESQSSTSDAAVTVPGPAASRPSPADPLDRKVLVKDDFEYLGAFALPKKACGWSTGFGETGIALRRVDGKLRLLTGSHRYSVDAIYEVEVPGFSKVENKWPSAKMVREWGDIYHGKNKTKGGKENGWVHGMNYDQESGRLYYSFASWYNIPPTNDPSLSYAVLDDSGAKSFGPWKASAALAPCQKIRGGTLNIPKWFAERYTQGRTLGLGFGGAYSGYSACANGQFLAAAHPPEKEGVDLDALPLIDHPPTHPALRNPDYKTEFPGQSNPMNGVGYWGWVDEILGGATWIDLPDKHGVLFIATMGHGRTWYEHSDIQADHIEASWFIFNPRDLAAVAQGRQHPWDPQSTFWKVDYTPRPVAGLKNRWRTPGCAFDATTRTLYVLVLYSYRDGVEWYPLIQGWRVR